MRHVLGSEWARLTALLITAAVLLLPRLGESCLNGDEAQLAVLARTTLACGLPRSWDGRNYVTREWGFDSSPSGLWTFNPWLPIYTVSASFALLGTNAFAARFPFVACALASVAGLYLIVRRNTNDPVLAFASAALLTLNVQFLLFARQCQWYSLATLLVVIAAWFYCELLADPFRQGAQVGLGISLAMLFYTDYFIYPLVVCGFLVHVVWFRSRRRGAYARAAAKALLLSLLIAAPWLLYLGHTRALPLALASANRAYRVVHPFGGVWEAGQFILSPLVLLYALARCLMPKSPALRRTPSELVPASIIIGTCLAFLPMARWGVPAAYAYFAHALPAFSVLVGRLLTACWEISRPAALLLSTLLVATNTGELWLPWLCNLSHENRHFAPARLQSYFGKYLGELLHGSTGPIDRLIEYINRRAYSDQALFVSYEAEPFIFHTRLRLIREIPFPESPKFIVLRPQDPSDYSSVLLRSSVFNPKRNQYIVSWQRPASMTLTEVHARYVRNVIGENAYRCIRLPASSSFWQNSPETRTRYNKLPDELPEVTLWEHPQHKVGYASAVLKNRGP